MKMKISIETVFYSLGWLALFLTSPGMANSKMAEIPAACFEMGSEVYISEEPIHTVCLDAFLMDTTEVTHSEYQAIMGSNSLYKQDKQLPVTGVSWGEAKAFCEKTGKRLPTEAEWEYAAGGGVESLYPWGYEMKPGRAWYQSNSGGQPHTAGETPPNRFGLYDMNGNVWEWVADWMAPNYYENSPKDNPEGPAEGKYKLLRSGSFEDPESLIRTAVRFWYPPQWRSPSLGFRCAADKSP